MAGQSARVSWSGSINRTFLDHVATLPKVSGDECCAKCGAYTPKMRHHNQLLPMEDVGVVPVVEWLELECFRCGAMWQRRPLDAQDPA